MTIDLTKLREAVLEELKLMSEINPAHDEKGRWAKKGKGKTYSLTKMLWMMSARIVSWRYQPAEASPARVRSVPNLE